MHALARVCREYNIYITLEVLGIHLILSIVQSVVCSPLVRHRAIEKTTVIIIIIPSAQSVQD